jgi:hypothetical protein
VPIALCSSARHDRGCAVCVSGPSTADTDADAVLLLLLLPLTDRSSRFTQRGHQAQQVPVHVSACVQQRRRGVSERDQGASDRVLSNVIASERVLVPW